MGSLVQALKKVLPARLRDALSRASYPYRHGSRLFRPYVIQKDMEGEQFAFLVGDRTGRKWYDLPCINNPVWLEMRFVRDHMVETGDVILECGGHHGCSTILLSRWVGTSGRVVSYEPFRPNFLILERNIRLNALQNVETRMEAVGAEDGTITFDESTSAVTSVGNGVTVKVTRLDDQAHLKPTFLKIDVEGYEMQVLEGAQAILATRPKIAMELHAELLAQFGASVDRILALIGVHDYDIWAQWRDDQEPRTYEIGTPITSRVHLFFMPRENETGVRR